MSNPDGLPSQGLPLLLPCLPLLNKQVQAEGASKADDCCVLKFRCWFNSIDDDADNNEMKIIIC